MEQLMRTDLALEAKERFEQDNVEIKGVILEKEGKRIPVTTVVIETQEAADKMQKPIGTYITIEIPEEGARDEKVLETFYKYFQKLKKDNSWKKALVVGLGNREVTPDRLGPEMTKYILVSRTLNTIAPGVLGQTGMETVSIIKGIVAETKPDVLVAVDALAARNTKRLNRTIQMTDTGIHPGAGVGNFRPALNRDTLGIDVIAVGVPTVVDALTIVADNLEKLGAQELLTYMDQKELREFFVTPNDIDESIFHMSRLLAEGMNAVFGE
ncbi:GPR endopeptidase [Anaerolentibacter hominis]|uniref:GPR endopeptidase n=1 Tax=Anaerolentibacter hominis TaxID=3079009 RepID=UPI0031B87637